MNDQKEALAVLNFWDGGAEDYVEDEFDRLVITIDTEPPHMVWLELSRRDGPSVRVRATRQLSIALESALNTARALAAIEGLPPKEHHAS